MEIRCLQAIHPNQRSARGPDFPAFPTPGHEILNSIAHIHAHGPFQSGIGESLLATPSRSSSGLAVEAWQAELINNILNWNARSYELRSFPVGWLYHFICSILHGVCLRTKLHSHLFLTVDLPFFGSSEILVPSLRFSLIEYGSLRSSRGKSG